MDLIIIVGYVNVVNLEYFLSLLYMVWVLKVCRLFSSVVKQLRWEEELHYISFPYGGEHCMGR